MSTPIITVKDVEVDFLLHRQGQTSLKQVLMSFGKNAIFETKHVLKGINLEINRGECIGLLGRNGSGKSTLLRAIAGIIEPQRGSIHVRGRIAPVLALGVGLEPELSGMENIKLCGSLMGFGRSEIEGATDKIIEFSGLTRQDINMQVKRYSSGMMARLGFSIAVATDPEILIIDEALAVGDKGFQEKCMNRLREIKEAGNTIIYVSHHFSEIKLLCDKVAYLKNGKIVAYGDVNEVGEEYHKEFK